LGSVSLKSFAGACWFLCIAIPVARAATDEAIQLSIGGGAVDSPAFRWSSAFAEILSRPPGLPDCDPGAACGVPDVVAAAQTFDDPAALLKSLIDGRIATAVMPAMRLYRARCPGGPNSASITALKVLYRQPLEIVARTDSKIAGPKDFAGKKVVIGERGDDSEAVALAMFDAYAVPLKKVKLSRLPPIQAVAALRSGAADAGVFIGETGDAQLAALIGHGVTLLSLPDGPERRALLKALPAFEPAAIGPNAYPGVPAISTVAQPVVWAAGPGLDQAIAGKLVAALSDPRNLVRLSDLTAPGPSIPDGEAFLRLPAPPASGLARFAESRHLPVGVVDCPAVK
jgi:TRAP-type uncharacterized transport system substrate-binding protein